MEKIFYHPTIKMKTPDKKSEKKAAGEGSKKSLGKVCILCNYANLSKLTLPIRISSMEP